jgi:hypothetical protein
MVMPVSARHVWSYQYNRWVWLIPARAANDLQTQDEVSDFEECIGLSEPHESYGETAYRLEEEGDEWNAELYEALEKRWFEVE